MSTIAITSLPVVTTGTVGDIFPIVQNGVTSQITNADLFNSVTALNGLILSLGGGDVASNIAIGDDSLLVNTTGSGNTAVGDSTLRANTIGIDNTADGRGALLTNVSGSYNVASGALALALATGSYNTAIGRNAGGSISSGSKNTIIGNYSGNQGGLDIRTLSNYVVLSDGDGNPRAYWNGANATFGGTLTLTGNLTATAVIGFSATDAVAPTVPSGSTITPLKPIAFISGTTVVNTISVPSVMLLTGGTITLIPTGAFTWTTAGNIAVAGTAVVSKALIMTYDYGTGKWYPSYV
jgi:hypothetical protein